MEVQAAVQEAPATEVPVVVTEEARQIVVKGQTKEQNRAEFLARYNKEKENAKSTVAVAETGADQSETVAQEQSTSTTESEAAEPDQGAGTTEQAVDEELAAAKALNDIARQGRIFKERQRAFAEKMSAQEKRLAEREARAAEIAKREEELTAAAKSGKKTAVIRRAMQAAGVPDSEIANFLTEALMEAADDEPPATPKAAAVPTLEELKAAIKADMLKEQEAEKLRQQKQADAQTQQQQALYFGQVKSELSTNLAGYPVLRALNLSFGEMDMFLRDHYNATGEALTAPQLLAKLEERYSTAATKASKNAPYLGKGTPPKKTAAVSKTLSSEAVNAAGSPVAEDKKDRKLMTVAELREEGKAKALAALAAKKRQ